jgi:tetratricopeptide (TPR) repeat protein
MVRRMGGIGSRVLVSCAAAFLGLLHLACPPPSAWAGPEPNSARGTQAYNAGRYQEAIGYYQHHLHVHPGCSVAYADIGRCYFRMGNFPQAAEYFSRALSSNNYSSVIDDSPALARAKDYGWRADTYMRLRHYPQAAQDYGVALRTFPNNADYSLSRGRALSAAGKHEEAVAAFSEALRNGHSDQALVFFERGRAYGRLGQYDRALEHYSEAIRMNPTQAAPYSQRVVTLLAMGHARLAAQEAELDVNRGTRLDANSQFTALYGHLGHRLAGREDKALRLLKAAADRSDPGEWPYPIVRYFLGELSNRALIDLAVDHGKMTEVQTFLALDAALKGNRKETQERLDWITKHGDRDYLEYDLAVEEARRGVFAKAGAGGGTTDDPRGAVAAGGEQRPEVTVGYRGSPGLRMPEQRPYKGVDSSRLETPDVSETNFSEKLEELPGVDEILKRIQQGSQGTGEPEPGSVPGGGNAPGPAAP